MQVAKADSNVDVDSDDGSPPPASSSSTSGSSSSVVLESHAGPSSPPTASSSSTKLPATLATPTFEDGEILAWAGKEALYNLDLFLDTVSYQSCAPLTYSVPCQSNKGG